MIGYAAQRLMEMEVGVLTGAADGAKSASRLCEDIDQRVKAFLDWPIEGDWPTRGSTPPT
jgi:hypothetical protein